MIVATAGHVDHGKTSLIGQLTGVDTDRLAEEKRRGLSINLGFAYRRLDDGTTLGFVDVPGHNRFINTMISGICGIDVGLLVVAVDDGPMPQTYEHIDVLRLLGVNHLLLVLTKTDRVDAPRLAAVRDQMLSMVPQETPVFPVSNIDGAGIKALLNELDERARNAPSQSDPGCFRLSIDRAFIMRGAGLVVTGTATAGSVTSGGTLTLLPSRKIVRVRSIHAQDQQVEVGRAGERCALNISGDIDKAAIERGDWLVAMQDPVLTRRFDASLRLLDSSPVSIKHLSPVRLHLGAKRIAAKLYLIEREHRANRLQAGEHGLVQLIVEDDIACCRGDLFLIRDDSESMTLGGGKVLDPGAPRSGKERPERLAYLNAMVMDIPLEAIKRWVLDHQQTLNFRVFCQHWNLRTDEGREILNDKGLTTLIKVVETRDGELLLSNVMWKKVNDRLLEEVRRWHAEHPAERGIQPTVLRRQLKKDINEALIVAALTLLVRERILELNDGLLRLAGHTPLVTDAEQSNWKGVEVVLQQCGAKIPLVSELATQTQLSEKQLQAALRRAVRDGQLCKINDRRYALPANLLHLAGEVTQIVVKSLPLTVQSYRDRVGVGRRLAVELLEYFDSIRFTQRRDQLRVIIDDAVPTQKFSQ